MKKILFVEDDLTIIRVYRGKLLADGFEVEVAADGQAALDSLANSIPDLVVLDLQLPKVSGVEVLKSIRSNPGTKRLPVVVFTNAFLGTLVQDAWSAGATKVLTKASCSPRQIQEIIQSILETTLSPRQSVETPDRSQATAPVVPSTAEVNQTSVQTGIVDLREEAHSLNAIRKNFLEATSPVLTHLRSQLMRINRGGQSAEQGPVLLEMARTTHSLTDNAAMAGFRNVAQLSSALEALTQELHEKPMNIHASSLRTLTLAVDALGLLLQSSDEHVETESHTGTLALAVDDDDICGQAVRLALNKANVKIVGLNDPRLALRVAQQNRFDLICLDVEMPELNGFELAAKLRELPAHKNVPIIFVTSLNDFATRARSTLNGGNDFIAKPFLLMELTAKALTHTLNKRNAPSAKPQAEAA